VKYDIQFRVNGGDILLGSLSIRQDHQTMWTDLPTADPKWEFTDSNGHYHAHSIENEHDPYPTLDRRSEHVDCDGSCGGVCEDEGYTVSKYSCRICKEEIEPGLSPGPHSFTVPGLREWSCTVNARIEGDHLLSVCMIYEGQVVRFGTVTPTDVRCESDSRGQRWETTLVGVGPLGSRKIEVPLKEAS
jgi:hypothetical protein